MYNFGLMDDEELVKVFDEVLVKQGKNEKVTTIAVTNKRLLFLDHGVENEGAEVLRIAREINYFRVKEVYYEINLKDITDVVKDKLYQVILKDNKMFEFYDEELFLLINNVI